MKKTIHNVFTLLVMLALIASSCLWTGCANAGKTNLLGSVKQVIVGDDYEAAGKAVGEASYTARTILAGNPKYDKYIAKYDEFCNALNNAESETVKLGTVNQVALDVMQAALTAKYGYAKASLITTGVRIGGAVADRIIAKRVDAVAADQFLKGFKEGLDAAMSSTPADAFIVVEKADEKPFDCPDGNCSVTITNRKTSHQFAVAQELIDGGYADKSEVAAEGEVTKYDNIQHFIERCKILKKYKVKKTDLYIKSFFIEGGKLKTIAFKMILDDGGEFDVSCVSCVDIPEIDNLDAE